MFNKRSAAAMAEKVAAVSKRKVADERAMKQAKLAKMTKAELFVHAKEEAEEIFKGEITDEIACVSFRGIMSNHHMVVADCVSALLTAKFGASDPRLQHFKALRTASQEVNDQLVRLEAEKSKVVKKHFKALKQIIAEKEDFQSIVEFCCTAEMIFAVLSPDYKDGRKIKAETRLVLGGLIHAFKNLAVATRDAFHCDDETGVVSEPKEPKKGQKRSSFGMDDIPDFVGDMGIEYFTQHATVFNKLREYFNGMNEEDEEEDDEDDDDEEEDEDEDEEDEDEDEE